LSVSLRALAAEHVVGHLNWDVCIVAGPSGVGKSTLSYPLARRFDVPIVEVDDLFKAVQSMTLPVDQPLIHYWETLPATFEMTSSEILNKHISVCRAMEPAIKSVIHNHEETRLPIIMEGDYILPEMMESCSERIRSIFIYEEQQQIVSNYHEREPSNGLQVKRAEVSYLFGLWLREECKRLGLVAIPARPWGSLIDRVIKILSP
jgi:2-phosphoglycerate kinase